MTDITIGIDISKDQLDVHCLPGGDTARFGNDVGGFQALTRWLADRDVLRLVYEPTGPYHGAFETALAPRFPLVKVNPLQARRFAQACGTRAKTDAVDARLLAHMGSALKLEPDQPQAADQRELKELQVARKALVKDRTRLLNRLKTQHLAMTRRHSKARLAQIEHQLKQIDDEIRNRFKARPQIARAYDIIRSIPGLGAVSAAAILIEMPEIGTLERKQAAALAGLAPMTRQSGKWSGKAFIQGGRKHLRDALYMPALVASRFNPDLKAKYTSLIANGKPAKVALIAIMRKLIELANALVQDNRTWTENPA